jgi:hypothetical protein
MSGSSYLEQRLNQLKGGALRHHAPQAAPLITTHQPTRITGNINTAPRPGASFPIMKGIPSTTSVRRVSPARAYQTQPAISSPLRVLNRNPSAHKVRVASPHRGIATSFQPQPVRNTIVSPRVGMPINPVNTFGARPIAGPSPIIPGAGGFRKPAIQLNHFQPRPMNFELLTQRDISDIEGRIKSGIYNDYKPTSDVHDPYYDKDRVLSEIKDLRGELGREQEKSREMQKRLLAELVENQKKSMAMQEKAVNRSNDLRKLEAEVDEIERAVEHTQRNHSNLKTHNTKLREDLINLGEETNGTINELDTKLNGILRLKDHEVENAKFEKDTADSEFTMICTEMDKDYGEKFKEIEEKIREANISKDKGERKLREIGDRVRNLHRDTERRARQVIDGVKVEASRNLEDSRKEMDARIKGIEQATRNMKLKNEDKIKQLQNLDREFKSKEMSLRSEHSRLKMDLDRYKKDNMSLKHQSDNLGKELGAKESDYARANMDEKIYKEKLIELEGLMDNDHQKLRKEIHKQEELMKEDLHHIENRSRMMEEEVAISKKKYAQLRAEYDSLMERLHRGLETTLNKEIDGFTKDRYGGH